MKKLFSMFAVLCAMFAMTACSNGPDETPEPVKPVEKGQEIVIRAQMADYTRATDTAFEEGDQVGLYVLLSEEHLAVNANLIKAYVNNGLFVADAQGNLKAGDVNADGVVNDQDKYYWYSEEYSSTLVGYYPRQEAWDYAFQDDVNFVVNADQSTHALYTASDLMLGVATASPSESAVALPFKHALSKVAVEVDNRSGEEIANVWLSNVLGSVSFNLADPTALEANGSKGTIKMAPTTNVANEEAWVAVIVPQADAEPELIITTVSEKQYTYKLAEVITFESGKQVTAGVTLSAQNISTAFTPTISDWTDDNDLNFKKEDGSEDDDPVVDVPAEENWGVVGDFNGWGTAEDGSASDTKMTYDNGIYTAEIVMYRAMGFKLRKDNAWEVNRGSAVLNEEGYASRIFGDKKGEFPVAADGADIFVSEPGLYVITWNAIKETMTVVAKANEPVADSWGLVGSFAASNWESDIDMTWSAESVEDMHYAVEVELAAGDEFKFRQNDAWELDFGGYELPATLKLDENYSLTKGGANIVAPATGTYTIYFYLNWQSPSFKLVCENPTYPEGGDPTEPVIENWGVVGDFCGWGDDVDMTWNAETSCYEVEFEVTASTTGAFKLRKDDDWSVNRGSNDQLTTLPIGQAIAVSHNGQNIPVPSAAGNYLIAYSAANETITVTLVSGGETTDPDPETPVVGERSEWGVVGAFNNWSAPDAAMYTTAVAGLYVAEGVTLSAFSDFKFRTNETWGTELTSDISGIQPNSWVVAGTGSNNTSVGVEGTYDIYLDTTNKRIYVMEPGADYTTAKQQTQSYLPDASSYVWGVVGDHNNWSAPDVTMEWDGMKYYVAYNVSLTAGKGFKIRANEEWNNAANYGVSSGATIAVNGSVDVYTDGGSGNIVVPATGVYDIYFDLAGLKVWLMTAGTKPAN